MGGIAAEQGRAPDRSRVVLLCDTPCDLQGWSIWRLARKWKLARGEVRWVLERLETPVVRRMTCGRHKGVCPCLPMKRCSRAQNT